MPSGTATYTLKFNADTVQARNELRKLKLALDEAISGASKDTFKAPSLDFSSAIKQASELRGIIEGATNAAGNFDLTKFTRSLKASGFAGDLQKVQTVLKGIGAEDSFNRLAMQIAQSNANVNILQRSLGKF
jgi:hypothetical protein